ncbi:right-handed parallel beta-helix repeat-containing protein [Microbacterium jejuense]|uniref:right-handed parallel beta-helix repeat-containing protein n=1 Tax=Microbacterium jejuense TaxID=1263637 RepID=UPI0031E8A114
MRRAAITLAVVPALALAPFVATAPAHALPAAAQHGAAAYYVAPDGDDAASGDMRHPFATIAHAQELVAPGDTVYLRGGRYAFTDAVADCVSQTDRVQVVSLTASGTADRPITYQAYHDETPVLDFSGVLDDCRIIGVGVLADNVVLRGLEITGARQNNNLNNESWGVWVTGSDNLFDQLDIHHNMGAGLFIQDGGGNVVRNSDSHDNYDPYSKTGAGQNADGFGSHTDTPTDEENLFEGDRAWNNADDGFDFISSATPVTVTRSWSWHNGYVYGTDQHAASGNGTGFKLGGYGGKYDPNPVRVTLTYSVAFDNTLRGIYANHHPLADEVYNNTSFDNGANYNMLGVAPDGSELDLGILRNNVSFGTGGLQHLDGIDSSDNSWDLGLQLSADDFLSVSHDGWDAPRQRDGSLPDIPNMRPAPGSALIDRGVDLGFGYSGAAPDLGAFEFDRLPHGAPGAGHGRH